MSPSTHEDQRRALARLALVLWTVLVTATGLALVSAACWIFVPPIAHDAAFIARYSVLPGFFYPWQPAKTLAYQLCLPAAPLLALAAARAGRTFIFRLRAETLRRSAQAALALVLLFAVACLRPLFYYPHPPLWLPPSWLLCPLPFPPQLSAWEWIVTVLLAIAFFFVVLAGFDRRPVRRLVVRTVIALAVLGAPVEFYAPSQVNEDDTAFTYHLNAMLDALSQSANGHHLLIDFPHIYGGYVELLAPLLRILPRTPAVPLLVLALPSLVAIGCWLAAAGRLVRNPAVLALTATGLLGVTYLLDMPPSYCYGTPRTFFPALVLLLVTGYLRHPRVGPYLLISFLSAIASIWNLDTGLIVWGGWTATLAAEAASARAWGRLAAHVLAQTSLLAAAWAGFLLYLRLASGRWPDVELLFDYQSLVLASGYFCVALIVPSAWTLLVLLYVTGFVVAVLAHLRRRVPWQGRAVLFLTLLGAGMFSYYAGRASESNLIAISPPGIILAGLLGSGLLARVRRGVLPPVARWFFLPWTAMIFWWAFLFFVHLPVILQREYHLLLDSFPTQPCLIEVNAAFARAHTSPGESDVYFISGHSGFYYYLTRTLRPVPTPGNVELLEMRDINAVAAALQAHKVAKLFAEPNFWKMDMYKPEAYAEITQAMSEYYQPVASSPGGLILYEPKSSP